MPMSKVTIGIAVAVVIAAGAALYPLFVGGSSAVPDELLQQFVYVDTNSGEAFLLRARRSPELHPETGEPTLIPGMYCEKCEAWKPVGPMENLQTRRAVHRCPVHKIPLTMDGPLPDAPE
jgi:hypothetical protein